MARELTRKLIDQNGHAWCVSMPPDVNADSLEDILVASHEGIVKLLGYQLDGDTYRLPADNSEILNGKKTFSFYKKIQVVDVAKEDFSAAMQALLDNARKSKINRARVTEWEGKPIKEDARGPYIDWEIPCHICNTPIKGVRRLSQSEGVFTRAQMFAPLDSRVTQYRPGSKLRVCGECAPKHLSPKEAGLPFPTLEEVEAAKEATLPVPPPIAQELKPKAVKEPLQELLELAGPKSDCDPMYLKGMIYGMLKMMKKGE